MRSISPVTRRRLAMQGFVGLDNTALIELAPWLRLAPTICAGWIAIGNLLASPAALWALMPFTALGAMQARHPLDLLYNYGIRYLLRTRPIPRYGAPRRFTCGLATVWLGITGWAYYLDAMSVGYALGMTQTIIAFIASTTDFCIPSFFYGLLFGKPAACAPTRM